MKFVLFVEGFTEREAIDKFLKKWLDCHLSKPVGIQIVKFQGGADLIKESPKKALLYLNGPEQNDIIALISLLDLYGTNIFPQHIASAEDRYTWGKKYMEQQIPHPKYRHYFSVHELEAWLLSDPSLFPSSIARKIKARYHRPEEIDFDEPPSKLLNRLFREDTHRNYDKRVQGKLLFNKLDPDTAYSKCPHLKELLDEMLILAKRCGF